MSEKTFKGKLTGIGYLYNNPNDYLERTGYELRFKSGSVFIETSKTLFLSVGDIIHFTVEKKEDKFFIKEIIGVEKQKMQKASFKERQAKRLIEARG